MLAGLAECERLLSTPAMRAVTTGGWVQPEGGEDMTPHERAELSLRRYSHTLYHPVGRRGWERMPTRSWIPSFACAGSRDSASPMRP